MENNTPCHTSCDESDGGDDDEDSGNCAHHPDHHDRDNDDSNIVMEVVNLVDPRITHLGEPSEDVLIEHVQVHIQHGSPMHSFFSLYVVPPPCPLHLKL